MTTPLHRAIALFLSTLGLAMFGALLAPVSAQAQAQAATPAAVVIQPNRTAADAAAGETRVLEPFEVIVLRGGINLVLRQGASPALRIQASDAEAALIEARVVQRAGRATLEIDQKKSHTWSSRHTPTVTVDWTTLSALTVQGAGDVSADGLATPALKLTLQGSGDVTLLRLDTRDLAISVAGSGDVRATGRATALAISVAGSGDVDAAALDADVVSVSIAGSGDVSVKANQTLSAKVAGSGDISYSGNPQLQTRVAGSGSVTRR